VDTNYQTKKERNTQKDIPLLVKLPFKKIREVMHPGKPVYNFPFSKTNNILDMKVIASALDAFSFGLNVSAVLPFANP
jgi:hypothetical protein